jgi:hypothetical protein
LKVVSLPWTPLEHPEKHLRHGSRYNGRLWHRVPSNYKYGLLSVSSTVDKIRLVSYKVTS